MKHAPPTSLPRQAGERSVSSAGALRLPWVLAVAFWLLVLLGSAGSLAGQASMLTPIGSEQTSLSGCDDCNQAVPLTSVFSNGINFGGTNYTQLYISTNGYVTFGHGNSSYSPQGIAGYTQGPVVAPQFDDLDPRKGGEIFYSQNTADGNVVVTWRDVMPYNGPDFGSGTNTLQMVLRRIGGAGSQDFQIEIRYVRLDWAKAAINAAPPTAGWSAGDQATYAEVPLSGQNNFLDLESMSNVGETGVFRWNVEGGIVESEPTVNQTSAVSAITGSSAQSGGNVSNDGGLTVADRGLVWSTSSGPTLSDSSASGGSGVGSFSAAMTGLSAGTTYYVRAYATNSLGTSYGPQRSFTTLSTVPPTVTTGSASEITSASAEVSGNVTSDGGGTVTARGVAWGTDPSPSTADATVSAGSGTGPFQVEIAGLDPVTTYYARAYATNVQGTSYGPEVSFTTELLPQSIDFPYLEMRTYGDGPVTLSATSGSELDVEFSSDDASVATVNGEVLRIVGSGTATITATQGGNELYAAAEPVQRTLRVQPRSIDGHFTIESEKVYDQSAAAVVTSLELTGVLPDDEGQVELFADGAEFDDAQVGTGKIAVLVGAELRGDRARHYTLTEVEPGTGAILPAPPHRVTLAGPTTFEVGRRTGSLTLTVRDEYGNETPVSQPTRFTLSSDQSVGAEFIGSDARPLRVEEIRVAAGGSTAYFRYRSTSAGSGTHTITAVRASGAALPGAEEATHVLTAEVGDWVGLRIEIVGGSSGLDQGEPFQLRIVAVDEFGNPVPSVQAPIRLSSDGPLSVPGGLEGRLVDGVLVFPGASFTGTGRHTIDVRVDDGSIDTAHATVEIFSPRPDIQLTVQVDRSRTGPDEIVEFTVRARNVGAGPAQALSLESPLQNTGRFEVIEVIPSAGSWNDETGLWEIQVLEAGAEVELTIRARAVGG